MSTKSYKRHRNAIKIFERLYEEADKVLIIHYAGESTYQIDEDRAPRIASIAVLDYKTKQTNSFSINKIAELLDIPHSQIKARYQELEKEMLSHFFEFVGNHLNDRWVSWKMKDMIYGFQALEFRFTALGGSPKIVPEDNKYQLSDLLKDKYGSWYISKGEDKRIGRFYALMKLNQITKKHLLNGAEEAECFANSEFGKVYKSTLSKVDALDFILTRAAENTLQTESKLLSRAKEFYGFSFQGLFRLGQDHWLVALIFLILGALLTYFIDKLLNLF